MGQPMGKRCRVLKPLRILWRTLLFISHLLIAILAIPFGPKIRFNGNTQAPPELIRWWMSRLCAIFHLQIHVTGTTPKQTTLVVPNDIPWLDIAVLGSLLHTSFLSKDEIRKWPVIGRLSRFTGTIFIRRGHGQAQQVSDAIVGHLQGDQVLTLFPEGKTSDGSEVGMFFPRLFASAIDAKIPVLPVAIHYDANGQRDLLAPYIDDQHIITNVFKLLGRKSSSVHVHFGELISTEGMERRKLAEASRQQIADVLDLRNTE